MDLNDYGTKEELIGVASTIRKTMSDFWMGKIDKKKFLRVYWEFEGFLLEHGYVEEDKYFKCELPDSERFLEKEYCFEDIRKAIGKSVSFLKELGIKHFWVSKSGIVIEE